MGLQKNSKDDQTGIEQDYWVISNLWYNLRKWKLTPSKTEREALEKDEQKVKRWLKEEWPKILKNSDGNGRQCCIFRMNQEFLLTPVLGKHGQKRKNSKIKVTGNKGGFVSLLL